MVEVLLALAIALHRVEPQLQRGDVALAIRAADNLVDGALDGQRAGLDQLGPAEDLVVLGEVVDLVGIADGDEFDKLPVVFAWQTNALLMGDAPHDGRVNRAAKMHM